MSAFDDFANLDPLTIEEFGDVIEVATSQSVSDYVESVLGIDVAIELEDQWGRTVAATLIGGMAIGYATAIYDFDRAGILPDPDA